MKLLLKQVTIADKHSPFDGLTKDILVTNGIIEFIADNISNDNIQQIEENQLMVSPGWVDVFAHFNDPGLEYKETIDSGINAAAAGGYTYVFTLPNTNPIVSTKSLVEYIVQKSKNSIVNVLPLGAITKNAEGRELAEMYDMRNSGAIAFSDGLNPVQTAGLLLKGLQYVKAFDGVIIQLPIDRSIGNGGLMNEGIISTQLGLPGLPSVAEELLISRDIELTKYTNSRLHITGVSTGKGLAKIRLAKQEGINVTCSVTPYHLFFCDDELVHYDTNLKVDPPLRTKEDMLELRKGIEDGTIDCIASHHLPQDWDHKVCEFEYAHNGMIGLQTTFSVINYLFPSLPVMRLVDLFSNNARHIFSLQNNKIEVNAAADFTLFSLNEDFVFTDQINKSLSKNSPFINQQLKGSVIGVVNKDKVYLNKTLQHEK